MELFLEDSLGTLAPRATAVALSQSPGIELLPVREGGAFEAHEHDDDHGAHDHDHEGEHDHEEHEDDGHAHGDDHAEGEMDMHFWLDPVNAKAMVAHIAATLAKADPDNAAAYSANAAAEAVRLDALVVDVSTRLAPVQETPFIVFHDAYQYFEHRFGLTVAGSITVTPDTLPGARRVEELRAAVTAAGAACVFAEPQFEPAIVSTIIEGSNARAGVLDPEGAELEAGPDLYTQLIAGLADSLLECLGS
jgi:zinc transport system substrate-binding protein